MAIGFHAAPLELDVMMDVVGNKHVASMELGAEAWHKSISSIQDGLWAFLEIK